jgi:Family of unknown function (DUF5684)
MDYSYSYSSSSGDAAGQAFALIFSACYSLFMLAFAVLIIAGMWKLFTKAGKPGWAAIVPIYNIIVLLEVIGRPTWWVVLYLIPFVNIVILFIVWIDLAKSFGKDVAYALGLIFLPFIFLPMLGFGKATYVGPAAATAAPTYYPPQPTYGAPAAPPYAPPAPPAYAPPAPPAPPAYAPPAYAPPAPPAPEAPSAPPAPPAPPAE